MMKNQLTFLITLALLTIPFGSLAQDHERITSFHSDILVNEDASLNVIETIQVYAAGQSIQRGIFRYLPDRYPVLRVERDGTPEPYHITKSMPGHTVYFGSEDVFLDTGFYTYTLEYSVPHEVRDFENHDEVYWNVTGNSWSFPIESATCTITLPAGIAVQEIRSEGYTGYNEEKGQDYATFIDEGGLINFQTTRTLNSSEGLTAVATFPKGHIVHPPWIIRLLPSTINSTASRVAFSVPVLVLAYMLFVWFMVGRDPRKGRVVPLNHPPEGVSPAISRYIMDMGYSSKIFTITLISLAIKGVLRIGQDTREIGPFSKDTYTLERTDDALPNLSTEETIVVNGLFAAGPRLEVDEENLAAFTKAQRELKSSLKEQCKNIYFKRNGKYILQGIVLMYVLLIWSAYMHGLEALAITLFMSIWLTGWTFGVYGMVKQVFTLLRGAITGRSISQAIGGIVMGLFCAPFMVGEFVGIGMLVAAVSVEFVVGLILSAIILAVFYSLLKAPTKEGREILDQLEGLKFFLRGDGKSRFASENDLSFQEQFEQNLPYAMALGLEQEWSKSFEAELKGASTSSTSTHGHRRPLYTPIWYQSSSTDGINIGNFGSSLSTAFASALSSASTSSSSSSSSSGSSGGGSSGGGGGGGGGGGW